MSLLLFACLNLQKEEEPEDPERRVSFEFVCGFLVELVKKETRFRLLYTFLTLLGLLAVLRFFYVTWVFRGRSRIGIRVVDTLFLWSLL